MIRRILVLLACWAAATAAAQADIPADPTTPEQLQARLDEAVRSSNIPGLALVAYRDGQRVFAGGAGLADRARGRSADADSHFRIGSITKTLLAIAILQQVDQGRLSLDDEIALRLPDMPISNRWQATDPVRVKHLLEHTAGFDDMHFRNMNARPGETAAVEMARFEREFEVRWRPGERMSYSNPGYGLLGYLLETLSGEDQQSYISRQVLAPLGMHATVWSADGIEATLAQGYQADGSTPVAWDHPSMPGAGSLVSTANDMARLLEYFLSGGRSVPGLLSAESFARIERSETSLAARAGLPHGYGAGNYATERAGWLLRGHSGGIPGYWANLQYQREAGFGYVVLFNVMESAAIRPLQAAVIGFASQGQRLPAEAPAVAADPQWNGWYHIDNPRNEFFGGIDRLINAGYLEAAGDNYQFSHAVVPESMPLVALADDQLRDADDRHPSGVLSRDADGRRLFVTDDNLFVQGSWWSVALPQYAVVAAVLLLLSCLLWAPLWAVAWLRGRLRERAHWQDRLWPLAATLVLAVTAWLPFGLNFVELGAGVASPRLLAIAAGGWLFAGLAGLGLLQSLRHWRALAAAPWLRGYLLLCNLAAAGLAVWLWRIDLLGIRLWAW